MQDQQEFDYVIVGGGSAGCVMAARLSEDPNAQVLLLEAGPADKGLMMRIPAGVYKVYHDKRINWNYESEPQPGLDDRRVPVPRGKTLGGSSSINAMVYLRGHPADYDAWAAAGLTEWSFRHCLPYFRRSETSDRGASEHRGASGPLQVERGNMPSPIFDAYLEAAASAGHKVTEDLNGPDAVAFGRMDATKGGGQRSSASVAYLRPAMKRPNLTVVTGASARRVLFADGRATGVLCKHRGQLKTVNARREVVLCGGAINSPQLLMLSGIGPASMLREHGIEVLADRQGVGRNLQDHLNTTLSYKISKKVSHAWIGSPLGKLFVGLRWLLRKDGPAASNIWEVGGFAKAGENDPMPAVHYHVGPVKIDSKPDGSFTLSEGFMIHLAQLRQRSRGALTLRSDDPEVPPVIDFRFLEDPRDLVELRESLKVTRRIAEQPALQALGAEEVYPGPHVQTDAEIDAHIRAHILTEFHPSCTCRMGVDADSVVDEALRVRGVTGLRVVDASVMPRIVGANLNATVIMIAEKAADLVRGRAPLPPANVAPATETEIHDVLSRG